MATIVNDRDKLLQAAPVRFVLPPIPPSRIPGLPGAFNDISQLKDDVEDLGDQINHLMNTSGSFYIRASALAFFGAAGTTTPSTITLTAERGSGLVGGTIAWTVFAGSATISPSSGDSTTVIGSTVTGRSVTIRARLTIDSAVYDAYATITRFGAVSAVDQINLTSQVTGSLAAGNVSGLGALALLNTVNLNTQTTGALNGLTQVTNLGSLAYANSIAANQIGAGTLAAGVIYAGAINADNITSGTITGRTFRTAESGKRIEIDKESHTFGMYGSSNDGMLIFNPDAGTPIIASGGTSAGTINALNTRTAINPGLSKSPAGNFYSENGCAIQLEGGTQNRHATVIMKPVGSLPADRTAGGICFYSGWLCFANGSHWFRSDGTQLT